MSQSRQEQSGVNLRLITDVKYTSSRQQVGHQRKHSHVTLTTSSGDEYTLVKTNKLGQGAFGEVNLFQSKDNAFPPLVIKEFFVNLPRNFHDMSYAEKKISDIHQLARNETYFNYCLTGFAHVLQTDEDITVSNIGGNCSLNSYPHSYMVTDYIDGTLFDQFQIDSLSAFFKLCIASLNALAEIHNKKIVHRDIKQDNMFVCHDDSGGVKIRFIDMTHAHYIGEKVITYQPDIRSSAPHFAPEHFQNDTVIYADTSQDIFSLGYVFKVAFASIRNKYSFEIMNENMDSIIMKMMDDDPKNRMTLEQVLSQITMLEERINLLLDLREEALHYEEDFPNDDAINNWCRLSFSLLELTNFYCIDAHDETMISVRLNQLSREMNEIESIDYVEDLTVNVIKYHIQQFITLLQFLQPKNRLILIKAWMDRDESFLSTLFINANHNDVLLCMSNFDQNKEFSILLFRSELARLQKSFASSASNAIEILDRWCFCQAALIELFEDCLASIYSKYSVLQEQKWDNGQGQSMLIKSLHSRRMSLSQCFKSVDESTKKSILFYLFNQFTGDNICETPVMIIKEIVNLLYDEILIENSTPEMQKMIAALARNLTTFIFNENEADFDKVLAQIDAFQSESMFYKELLLVCNDLYRDHRKKDKRQYFHFFSQYSLEDKTNASNLLALQARMNNGIKLDFDKLPGAANEGNLGKITQRLRRVL